MDAKPFLLGSLLMYNANAVIAQQDIIRHKCQVDSIDSICNVGFFCIWKHKWWDVQNMAESSSNLQQKWFHQQCHVIISLVSSGLSTAKSSFLNTFHPAPLTLKELPLICTAHHFNLQIYLSCVYWVNKYLFSSHHRVIKWYGWEIQWFATLHSSLAFCLSDSLESTSSIRNMSLL